MATDNTNGSSSQSAKLKATYPQKYRSKWENEPDLKDWLEPIPDNELRAFCVLCKVSVLARLSCLRAHAKGEKHVNLSKSLDSEEHEDNGDAEIQIESAATEVEKEDVAEDVTEEAITVVCVDDSHEMEAEKSNQKQVQVPQVQQVEVEKCVAPWQQVTVLIHGPFEPTSTGVRFVISATDMYSKWIEARSLQECDAKSIADFLVDCLTRLGFCKYIFLNFSEELSSEISEEMKMQTQGIIPDDAAWEKLLCFANCAADSENPLGERIAVEGAEWDRHLRRILFELRTSSTADSNNRIPFRVLHNREFQGVLSLNKPKRKSGRPKKIVELHDRLTPKPEAVIIARKFLPRRLQAKHHSYGLRTTLKSQAKSSVVSRMLQKSRLKRSMMAFESNADKNKLNGGKRKEKKLKKVCQDIPNKDQEANNEILPHSPTRDVFVTNDVEEAVENEVDDDDDDVEGFMYQDECYDDDTMDDDAIDEAGVEAQYNNKEPGEKKTRKVRIKLDALTDEQRQEIEGVEPSVCPRCEDVGFLSQNELDMHSKFHKEDPEDSNLYCVYCSKEESVWQLMQLHLVTHIEAPVSLMIPIECFTCRECSKVVNSIDNVEKHLQYFHRRRAVVVCKTCGLQSRTHRRYLAHSGAHSDTTYECITCRPRFQTKSFCAFAEHHIIHQGGGIQCTNCERMFPSEYHVKDHQKNHKKMEEVNICEFCGKQFFGISAMRHHLRYFHNDNEVYACDQCSYVGRTKSNLRGHIDRIHKKPFKCPECDYACLAEKTLLKHIDMFHNAANRQFPCSLCAYRGRDVKTLAEHIRIRHRITNGFCCPTCQTVFKTRTLLRDHMPTHTGARAYACKLCDYTAKYRPTMYRHVMSKHPGETLSSASTVAGRERRPRSPSSSSSVKRKNRIKMSDELSKVETEKVVSIEGVYSFGVGGDHDTGELILHGTTIDEDDDDQDDNCIEVCAEDEHAVTNIPDSNNMVAIMDANLLAEMAASGQVCVQYIEDVGSIETIEVHNDGGIELDSETSKAVKEKFQMLTTGLTFSCL